MMPFYDLNIEGDFYDIEMKRATRGTLTCVHSADWHFGAFSPKLQYSILNEQFISKIENINFDILTINGDLFDHKTMSNSDIVFYALKIIEDCVNMCIRKNATLVIIHGTLEHDANQLQLFYNYLRNPNLDLRIVEKTKFEYIKGAKVLCIPEEYDKGSEYYNNFLLWSGEYDMCLMHGTFKGAIYQDKVGSLDSKREPTFNINDFQNCKGPIISGHVHTPGCFSSYFYYCGCPYVWKFGEEIDKGFLVTLHNLDNGGHYAHFEKIISMKYITVNIDDLLLNDPNEVIKFIKNKKENENIDYLRIEISKLPENVSLPNIEVIKNYFRNNTRIKVKDDSLKNMALEKNKKELEHNSEYSFILDKNLTEYEILAKYINIKKENFYITAHEIIELLQEEI